MQDQALSTFNFLNAEKRYIAAGLIPPSYLDASEDEQFRSLQQHRDPMRTETNIFGPSPIEQDQEILDNMRASRTQGINEYVYGRTEGRVKHGGEGEEGGDREKEERKRQEKDGGEDEKPPKT